MADTDSVTIEIGDREASLGFPGSAYVLPKVGSTGLPLVSVNIEKAKLQLLRITDRNLVQQIRQGRWLRAIDGYERDQIPEEYGDLIWKGEVDIQSERNKRMTTLSDLRVLPRPRPHHVLTAESASGRSRAELPGDPEWFVIRGLTVSGATACVFVRSPPPASHPNIDLRLSPATMTSWQLSHALAAPPSIRPDPRRVRPQRHRRHGASGGRFRLLDLSRRSISATVASAAACAGVTDAFMYTIAALSPAAGALDPARDAPRHQERAAHARPPP
jgi:hypothetical protein